MSTTLNEPVWRDTLSPPRNIDTREYRVKVPCNLAGWEFLPGDVVRIWPQGEKFVNMNGLLCSVTMRDVAEWLQAELIVAW